MTSETVISEVELEEEFSTINEIEDKQQTTQKTKKISKKVWIVRISFLFALIFLMSSNIIIALQINDPLIFYSTLMPTSTILIFFVGWFFFKNTSNGKEILSEELVSVIIPIYNQKALIERVIDSVFKSTYSNIEVIAVNDGSYDGTHQILNHLEKRYRNLKVIHKINEGKRRAVSQGFYESNGKYVVLMDSDSIVEKEAIEEFMKTFQSHPEVGAVVGMGKVLNSDQNFLTKCQDSWYDSAFNIHKTTESVFGSVLCCSGCLAGYRREAIADFIPYWMSATHQNSDDRELTTYAIATSWAKRELTPIKQNLKKSMAQYDDAEDRGLTAQTLTEWKTVYVPSAVVHTEVPCTIKSFIRQQTRWKKGYLRTNFFVSAFFWRKHPLMSLIFYIQFMSTFISPIALFAIYFYTPFILNNFLLPLWFLFGQLIIGLIAGLDYKFREPKTKMWKYKPIMNVIATFILPWLLFPALWTFRKNQWLTR